MKGNEDQIAALKRLIALRENQPGHEEHVKEVREWLSELEQEAATPA